MVYVAKKINEFNRGWNACSKEKDADIAELENRLNMFVNKDISYDEMCGLIAETRMYLINKHKVN